MFLSNDICLKDFNLSSLWHYLCPLCLSPPNASGSSVPSIHLKPSPSICNAHLPVYFRLSITQVLDLLLLSLAHASSLPPSLDVFSSHQLSLKVKSTPKYERQYSAGSVVSHGTVGSLEEPIAIEEPENLSVPLPHGWGQNIDHKTGRPYFEK